MLCNSKVVIYDSSESETAENVKQKAIFKQNYILQLFIAFKMTYFCCFRFSRFPPKKFNNIHYWSHNTLHLPPRLSSLSVHL